MTTFKTKGGEIQKKKIGQVTCSRYVGEFSSPELQSKAETGMWYTMLSGNPHVIQGEGVTTQAAIKDSIVRTKEKMGWMQKGLDSMAQL